MFISTSPAALPVIQATPEPRVTAPQPVKAPTFAKLLQQSRPAPAPAPTPVAAPSPAAKADTASEPPPADEGTSATPANGTPRGRVATADKPKSPAAKTAAKTEAHEGDARTDNAEPATRSADTALPTGEHPLLAQWLSHLHRPVDATVDTPAGGTAAEDDTSSLAGTADTPEGNALAASTNQAAAGHDRADAAQASFMATADSFAQRVEAAAVIASASAEANASHTKEALAAPIDASAATPASAAGFAASVSSAAMRPAEPTAVAIATPVNAPDFSQVLGVQLSVLAKDGIQHAELHLNPADMGPVSVKIEMTGSQAHIDFGADVAATRHAIEAGLPELASALRDAGFTLSGGGVSQHSRGGSEPGGERDREAGRAGRGTAAIGAGSDGLAAPTSALRRNVALGGLDLYA